MSIIQTFDSRAVGCHEPAYHAVCADKYPTQQLQWPVYNCQAQGTLKLVQYVRIVGTGSCTEKPVWVQGGQ